MSIIIKVSDLRSRIQDMRRSGMDYVELTILEESEYDGEILPASLELSGCKNYDTDMWVDFEGLYEVENNKELHQKSASGVHMSDNLL